jgi:transposase
LRSRVVAAYLAGEGSAEAVAKQFGVSRRALQRWVERQEADGTLAPRARGGGRFSPVVMDVLHDQVRRDPSATAGEVTRAYNRAVSKAQRVHRSSIFRALHRAGYVFKKNVRVLPSKTAPTSS